MTTPWLTNLWACNPFAAEPDREAAVATGEFGGPPPPSLADVLVAPTPVKDPKDYSTADWYRTLVADWPTVPNVIPEDKQVRGSDDLDVVEFLRRVRFTEELPEDLQCFDRADYQMYVMEFRPSGPPALDDDSVMVLHEVPDGRGKRTEVQVFPMIRAVQYLK